ncbi:MAG: PEP-CTERM sorting domain-containing protein [Verrucomicrobia bacterium]|nr:PEP-CTERM sorting domain-containing protein [Verrucomicrobiota bacterium]
MSTLSSPSPTGVSVTANAWYAMKFSTGSTGADLRSLQLHLDESKAVSQWLGSSIYLYASDGSAGAPGTRLATYAISDVDTISTFGSLTSDYALAASSSYWLVAAPAADSAAASYYLSTSATYSVDTMSEYQFYTSSNVAYTTNKGTSWFVLSNPGVPLVSLSTNAVPEPGTFALLGLGAASGLYFLRRRSRAA